MRSTPFRHRRRPWTDPILLRYNNIMKAEIRLFANFRDFLPEGSKVFSYFMSFDGEKTVHDVIHELKLPDDIPRIIIVNGIHAEADHVIKDGDVVSLFPPLAGG
jgi:molybdopterin converting factor small subunit